MSPGSSIARGRLWAASAAAALLAIGALFLLQRRSGAAADPLVVYCAHDAVYAEKILRQFEKETGVPLSIRYDTEATKSLNLVELLLREGKSPRCDVFWNNQLVGTDQLKAAGLLEPYKGPGYERIPSNYRDADGCWTGFAARLRVYIINTDRLKPEKKTDDVAALVDRALKGDLSRVAIAKPLYGTTLTQYSAMWANLGPDSLKAWHADWRRRGVREVAGNAAVKDLVAQGVCDVGLTDTDDYFEALDNGAPVSFVPFDADSFKLSDASPGVKTLCPSGPKSICIPNTVAMVRGSRHAEAAHKLIDYLLSERVQLALSASGSRQIPLGDTGKESLSSEVVMLKRYSSHSCDLQKLGDAPDRCLEWLKAEYAK
ncbi:MAG: extracellular solute-binding protein [Planctomycetota bacterium]|nr:extracellular solute-binding protein [Planctomycetota bacterium]